MSLEEDCLSLFESLKSIQCNQNRFKDFSDKFLRTLKLDDKNTEAELKACKQEDDLSMRKLSNGFNSELKENDSDGNLTRFEGSSYFNKGQETFGKITVNSFHSHNQGKITTNKFPYLKKRQGLSRFKSKICKGFKKKYIYECYATNSKNPVEIEMTKSSISKESQEKKHNFEKLEELVESESFCSTSSKVLELLQGSISSYSSPLSSKVSFVNSSVSNQESVSIGESYRWHRSPVRKPLSCKQTFVNSEVQMCDKELQVYKNIENNCNNINSTPLSSSSDIFISGILKKGNGSDIKSDSYKNSTPLFTKVKFLEQGVKVLEYEDDENITSCSDETDLLSSSDFENLALINFNSNLNQENSLSTYFSGKEKSSFLIEGNEKSQNVSASNINMNPLCCMNKCEIDDKNASPQHNCAKVESLGEKSCKMLLLAKIYELDKEISIFKTKNKYLEKGKVLEEKQNPDKTPTVAHKSFRSKKYCVVKSKDSRHSVHESALPSEVSLQVQKRTKELINLKREYSFLKKKDLSLERRKTATKKVNEVQPDLKKMYENSVTIQSHISYQSQNMNTKPIFLKDEVPSSRYPMSSSDKGAITSVSKNSVFYTASTSLYERSLLQQDSRETDDFIPSEIKYESADNAIPTSLEKTTRNPQISNVFPLKLLLSSEENYKGTKTVNVLKDFVVKQDENMMPNMSNETDNYYSLEITEDKLPSVAHSSCIATTSFKVPPSKVTLPKDNKIKLKLTKESGFSNLEASFNDLTGSNDGEKTKSEECNILTYSNGDKEIKYSNRNVYYYALNNSTHTVYTDERREELKFANGQKEIYNSDGSFEVTFPDSSSKIVYADGTENFFHRDGTQIHINSDKTKVIHFSNGQKEIYKGNSIWRVYPDGTTKILYKDGREETRYLSGKIRLKNSNGVISVQKA